MPKIRRRVGKKNLIIMTNLKTTLRVKKTLPKSLLKEARSIIKNRWIYLSKNYQIQEQIIDLLFKKTFPYNTDIDVVKTKAATLNVYYSTHVQAIQKMAHEIVNLNIDNRLMIGDITLVPDIAKALGTNRIFRSFASKYCAVHNNAAFPIYDRLVRQYLAKVIRKGNLAGYTYNQTTADDKLHDYMFYVKVYNAFMKQYHLTSLTYRQVDWYIWVAQKCKLQNLDLFKLI